MTQMPSHPPLVVKPQPNVYTILLVLAIVALGVTIGLVLHNLMADVPKGYGFSFGDVMTGALPK